MFRIFRRTVAVLLLAGAALVAVPAAAADTLVTLTGEEVTANPGTSTVNVQCGSPSTVTYHAVGTAVGPYPGTFVEDGSMTFGADGVVQSFSATFSIDSPAGDVSGQKQLDPSGQSNFGSCEPQGSLEFAQASFAETYQATITDALGRTFTETGRATTLLEASEPATGPGTLNVMAQSFQSGGPPGLTMEVSPLTAVNPTGTSHTVTAIVRDATGEPVQGITVRFVVTGSSAQTSRCVTDADGVCNFTYLGPDRPGADEITACADTNLNGEGDVGEPCAAATKAWSPAGGATPGGAHGGGHLGDAEVVFGFSATATDPTDPIRGACNVFDRVQDVHVKCVDITSLVVTPTHATFLGAAEQDGIATTYRIDVDDLSGSGLPDTFRIETGQGYVAVGPVTAGNIVVNP